MVEWSGRAISMDAAAVHARAYGRPDTRLVAMQHSLAAPALKVVMQRADAVVAWRIEQLMTAH